jgi:hypothetical protein
MESRWWVGLPPPLPSALPNNNKRKQTLLEETKNKTLFLCLKLVTCITDWEPVLLTARLKNPVQLRKTIRWPSSFELPPNKAGNFSLIFVSQDGYEVRRWKLITLILNGLSMAYRLLQSKYVVTCFLHTACSFQSSFCTKCIKWTHKI